MDFDIDDLALTFDLLNQFDEGITDQFPPACTDFLFPAENIEDQNHGVVVNGVLLQPRDEALELKKLASFLNSEDEWINDNN